MLPGAAARLMAADAHNNTEPLPSEFSKRVGSAPSRGASSPKPRSRVHAEPGPPQQRWVLVCRGAESSPKIFRALQIFDHF